MRRHQPRHQIATEYLSSRTRFGIKFGLDTIRALVAALGHPEQKYATLLVAGTNGKGSVVAYADAALRASGLRVGRYTSPHLVKLNERVAVDGRDISDRKLAEAVERVRETAEELVVARTIPAHPTHFEALTAAAYEHFSREKVDVAVLEVGMGGRLDATNVCEPLASAIVSVDLDHQKYLGDSVAAIAREKAGVLRRGRVTVLGPLSAAARETISAEARAAGARLLDSSEGIALDDKLHPGLLEIRSSERRYEGLHSLAGAHQHSNLIVALRLIEEARTAGLRVELSAVSRGINRTRWPGRLEWIPGDPPLLLDGAHNPAAARAVAEHLRGLGRFVLLFGVMADKDVAGIAEALFPLAEAVVLTRPRVDRAASPAEIAVWAAPWASGARQEADTRRALSLARALAPRGHPVVVAGSLYLVGEVMRILKGRSGLN